MFKECSVCSNVFSEYAEERACPLKTTCANSKTQLRSSPRALQCSWSTVRGSGVGALGYRPQALMSQLRWAGGGSNGKPGVDPYTLPLFLFLFVIDN